MNEKPPMPTLRLYADGKYEPPSFEGVYSLIDDEGRYVGMALAHNYGDGFVVSIHLYLPHALSL